jgi:hypothetical protein
MKKTINSLVIERGKPRFRRINWTKVHRDCAVRDQGLAAEYYALAGKLRDAGELERAAQWQDVAASYARSSRNALFHFLEFTTHGEML